MPCSIHPIKNRLCAAYPYSWSVSRIRMQFGKDLRVEIMLSESEQIKKETNVEIEEVEIVKENVIFKTPGRLN